MEIRVICMPLQRLLSMTVQNLVSSFYSTNVIDCVFSDKIVEMMKVPLRSYSCIYSSLLNPHMVSLRNLTNMENTDM